LDAILTIGGEVRFDTVAEPDSVRRIRETIGQLLQVKNLALLIGSGASFHLGSPAIRRVSQETVKEMAAAAGLQISAEAEAALSALVPEDGVDLETLLASLTNSLAYASSVARDAVLIGPDTFGCDVLRELRRTVNISLAAACDLPNNDRIDEQRFLADPWLAHREFFRRLLRSRRLDLPRVKVFTSNYDLVIERTLDDAGIPYFDGFVGTVDRVMRLETYQQDLYLPPQGDSRRLMRVPNVLYLYKIHGSVNWRTSTSLAAFGTSSIKQSATDATDGAELTLIYPTPHKESDVLGHPYADLLRMLSTTLSAPETAILIVGYGFADEHINRLILQTLPSNPTLQIFIVDPFGVLERQEDPSGEYSFGSSPVARLAQIPDQRLAVLTGMDARFSTLAEAAMPDPDDFAVDESASLADALERAIASSADTAQVDAG